LQLAVKAAHLLILFTLKSRLNTEVTIILLLLLIENLVNRNIDIWLVIVYRLVKLIINLVLGKLVDIVQILKAIEKLGLYFTKV